MSKLSYQIVMKAVAFFVILDQIRQQATVEEDRQLTESIKLHGILQALGARSDGKLVWGHRRLRCAIAAGLKEVPCVLLDKDMTEGQYLTLQMLENVQRADLSTYDMWQGCVRLQEANNWQLKDIAQALSLDPATVTRLMSISKCSPAWIDALKSGKVCLGDCYAASRLPEAEQPGLLALKLGGLTRDAFAQAAKQTRAPKAAQSAVRVQRVKCILSSGVNVVVSGEGVSLDESIEALGEAIKEMKRARDLGYTAKTFAAAMRDKSKAV